MTPVFRLEDTKLDASIRYAERAYVSSCRAADEPIETRLPQAGINLGALLVEA